MVNFFQSLVDLLFVAYIYTFITHTPTQCFTSDHVWQSTGDGCCMSVYMYMHVHVCGPQRAAIDDGGYMYIHVCVSVYMYVAPSVLPLDLRRFCQDWLHVVDIFFTFPVQCFVQFTCYGSVLSTWYWYMHIHDRVGHWYNDSWTCSFLTFIYMYTYTVITTCRVCTQIATAA